MCHSLTGGRSPSQKQQQSFVHEQEGKGKGSKDHSMEPGELGAQTTTVYPKCKRSLLFPDGLFPQVRIGYPVTLTAPQHPPCGCLQRLYKSHAILALHLGHSWACI